MMGTQFSRLTGALPLAVGVVAWALPATASAGGVALRPIGTYATGTFDQAGAEIVKYDERTQRLFVVNAQAPGIEVLDVADPTVPTKVAFLDVSSLGGVANSVAVSKGILAVAIEGFTKTDPGVAAFFDTATLALLGTAPTGAQPDMITFTPNGRFALTANEGEPSDDYTIDPEGSVTFIELAGRRVRRSVTARFDAWIGQEDALRASGVRIYGPGANAAQDFEPEYIAFSQDGRTAYVALQENNAIAVLDVDRRRFTDIRPLGFKDHSLAANALDASDRDGGIVITTWPLFGMFQPDAIASYKVNGRDYLVTANEGDSRDWAGLSESKRVKDLVLDPTAFPTGSTLRKDANLGRLNVTNQLGDLDGDLDFDALYAFGGRSFSIWDDAGHLVFDSGDQLEQLIATLLPTEFNSDHAANQSLDSRSDNKGPEPEGLALGVVEGRTYAFLALERIGGVATFDITDPAAPVLVDYVNPRDFAGVPGSGTAGDLGPEGVEFIPASKSPTGAPLLAVANEVSGTTTLYAIDET